MPILQVQVDGYKNNRRREVVPLNGAGSNNNNYRAEMRARAAAWRKSRGYPPAPPRPNMKRRDSINNSLSKRVKKQFVEYANTNRNPGMRRNDEIHLSAWS